MRILDVSSMKECENKSFENEFVVKNQNPKTLDIYIPFFRVLDSAPARRKMVYV